MMARAVSLLVLAAGTAYAGPTTLTAEGGAETDTNVERVDTGPAIESERTTAPVVRLGARVDHRGKLWGGTYAATASALARLVADGDVPRESVTLLAGDARYFHPLGSRPVSAGVSLAGADALPVASSLGARTFRTAGANAVLILRGEANTGRTLTLTAGLRSFQYKPNPQFDWFGPAASARLDLPLWQTEEDESSLELSATFGFEGRAYESAALASACAPDAEPSPDCFAATTQDRHDRFQRASLDLTYTGPIVAAVGYLLTVIDSNSFGQSIVRHRIQAAATIGLPAKLIGSVLATLQLDQYFDGLLLQKDLQFQEFTSLDDVNRSSLQLRVARTLSDSWSAEARAALWRDFGSDTMFTSYRRELVYLGVVFSH